jgi:hypothetical protein
MWILDKFSRNSSTGVVALGKQFGDFVAGYVCQSPLDGDPRFLYWTPGVKLAQGGDALGQKYRTPETAVAAVSR